jgi:ATP-dependent protease Clp ATPase subunit
VRVLTEPKNALVKQFSKLLSMDGVELNITKRRHARHGEGGASHAAPARAALRSIFERLMLDVMYDVPSRLDVRGVSINEAVVKGERRTAAAQAHRPQGGLIKIAERFCPKAGEKILLEHCRAFAP